MRPVLFVTVAALLIGAGFALSIPSEAQRELARAEKIAAGGSVGWPSKEREIREFEKHLRERLYRLESECLDRIRAMATYPSTVDFDFGGTRSTRFQDGSVRVNAAFTAKNGLGAELPYWGTCLIRGAAIVEAYARPR